MLDQTREPEATVRSRQQIAKLDSTTEVRVGQPWQDIRSETWFRIDALDSPTRNIFGKRFPSREIMDADRGGDWDWATFDEFLSFYRRMTPTR